MTRIGRLWRKIKGWFRRKPKQLPAPQSATLATLAHMYKVLYSNRNLQELANRKPCSFATLKKEDAPWRSQYGLLPSQTQSPQLAPSVSTELQDTTLSLMALTFHRNRASGGPN